MCQFNTCNNTEKFASKLSHHKAMWRMESIRVVLDDLSTTINRLLTAMLLVVMLFACQQMSEGKSIEEIQPKQQTN